MSSLKPAVSESGPRFLTASGEPSSNPRIFEHVYKSVRHIVRWRSFSRARASHRSTPLSILNPFSFKSASVGSSSNGKSTLSNQSSFESLSSGTTVASSACATASFQSEILQQSPITPQSSINGTPKSDSFSAYPSSEPAASVAELVQVSTQCSSNSFRLEPICNLSRSTSSSSIGSHLPSGLSEDERADITFTEPAVQPDLVIAPQTLEIPPSHESAETLSIESMEYSSTVVDSGDPMAKLATSVSATVSPVPVSQRWWDDVDNIIIGVDSVHALLSASATLIEQSVLAQPKATFAMPSPWNNAQTMSWGDVFSSESSSSSLFNSYLEDGEDGTKSSLPDRTADDSIPSVAPSPNELPALSWTDVFSSDSSSSSLCILDSGAIAYDVCPQTETANTFVENPDCIANAEAYTHQADGECYPYYYQPVPPESLGVAASWLAYGFAYTGYRELAVPEPTADDPAFVAQSWLALIEEESVFEDSIAGEEVHMEEVVAQESDNISPSVSSEEFIAYVMANASHLRSYAHRELPSATGRDQHDFSVIVEEEDDAFEGGICSADSNKSLAAAECVPSEYSQYCISHGDSFTSI